MKIPLPAWAPDIASNDASVCAVARNVFPRPDGWGPVPAPNVVTGPLPGACRGSVSVQAPDGSWTFYAGTTTKLYRANSGSGGWDDVSGSSPYLVPETDYWSFALYGTLLIATHTGAPPQVIDIVTGAAFGDLVSRPPLTVQPPRARFVTVVNEFVFFGGLLSDPTAVQWSGIGDPYYWLPGTQYSDIQILPDGGHVTALVGGESLIVFQDRAIQQMTFTPGTAEVFQRSKLESDRGAVAPWSVLKIGAVIYFLDRDGVYAFSGGVSVPVGKGKVNAWIQATRDPTYIQTAVAVPDPTGNRVLFAFKSDQVSDTTLLDQCIVYDYQLDRWSQLDLQIRHWLRTETAPVSIDAIDEDIDAGTAPYDFAGGLSLDSAIFSGGIPMVGLFGTDNCLALLEGPSLEARIETPDAQLARPRRTYARGVRVDTDADSWFARVGTRESLGASVPVRWRGESGPNAERFAPCHASGRYHRVQVRIPAGDPWSYAVAVEPDATPEGSR